MDSHHGEKKQEIKMPKQDTHLLIMAIRRGGSVFFSRVMNIIWSRIVIKKREVDDGQSSLSWVCRQRDTVMHANVNISTPLKSIQMCLFRWKINKAVRERHTVLQNPADNVISPASLQQPQVFTLNWPFVAIELFIVNWTSV